MMMVEVEIKPKAVQVMMLEVKGNFKAVQMMKRSRKLI